MEPLKLWRLPDGTVLPALCGGDGPDEPARDPELVAMEKQLLGFQLDVAKKGQKLEPILLEQAGLKEVPATGEYEYIDPSLHANKREIERLQTQRSLRALKGELPVSETLKKELEEGQNRLNERLYRQLGPGFENSTPGRMAQREYDTMAIQLKEGEQRDMMTTAEALSLARGQNRITEGAVAENPFASQARLIEPASAGVTRASEQDNISRGYAFRASEARDRDRSGGISGAIGMAGLMGALALSDPAEKTDIEPVSDAEALVAVRKIPVYKWRYKADPTKKKRIGGMAPDFPREVSDGKTIDIVSAIGLLTSSVKEIDRKVRDLQEDEETAGMLLATG